MNFAEFYTFQQNICQDWLGLLINVGFHWKQSQLPVFWICWEFDNKRIYYFQPPFPFLSNFQVLWRSSKVPNPNKNTIYEYELDEFNMVSQPIRLILVDWFVFHFIFLGRNPFFFRSSSIFFLRSSSIFCWRSSFWLGINRIAYQKSAF